MESKRNQMKWNMFEHAYRTVPLYRDILDKKGQEIELLIKRHKWEEIPIIEKNQLVACDNQIISDEHLADVALERIIHTHTSGSTGTFLDVYWNKKDLNRALVPLWMERWKVAGIYPNDRVCQFNTTLPNNNLYEVDGTKLYISKQHLFDHSIIDIYNQIIDFSPKWFIIHPAIACSLLELIGKYDLPKINGIKYVELTGEMVLPGLVERIEKEWNCIVRKHYGSMEVQTIGYQEDDLYKIYEQSTFIEILDDFGKPVEEGVLGNVYITSLHNTVMPIIRYGLGDIGCLYTKKEGKKNVKYLKLSEARKNDLIYISEKERIPADILLKPVELINGCYQNVILQFQAYQIASRKIEIKVVIDEDFNHQKFIDLYLDTIKSTILGHFEFAFEFSKCLFPKSNGKMAWFVLQLKGE